ncbi:hypothetical protein SAMN05421819_3862 [Bryocella elongata]|uniref:Uncharacterized protein n=1 Tax=Bryocella elongata TaxID=863522 RepID=A0A1H6BMU1_9BACT|nr:hypothetical protein [Bryocella elongata]SEG62021.1 hypothetical protein SAMN05421819_3862 [Bryocella elongata]
MGFAMSWLAVKGVAPDLVLETLKLARNGEIDDFPAESAVSGKLLSTGWFVLAVNRGDHKLVRPGTLQQLSALGEVVACNIEEHVMMSTAEAWRNGVQVWSVIHDAQRGIANLETVGDLPDNFHTIKQECAAELERAGGEKSDTDFLFDIPVRLAQELTGFRYDAAGDDNTNFEVLVHVREIPSVAAQTLASPRPWWKFW